MQQGLMIVLVDFHLVGSAIGPHAKFGVCCVMDFAGGLKDKSSLVMHDCEVTCTGEMTAEFRKVSICDVSAV